MRPDFRAARTFGFATVINNLVAAVAAWTLRHVGWRTLDHGVEVAPAVAEVGPRRPRPPDTS